MSEVPFSVKLVTFLSGFSGVTAYAVILGVLLACGLGVPIPEDITLVSAGVLAALGNISFWGAMIAGFVGVLVGDTFLFFLGRKLGNRAFGLPGFRRVFTEKRIQMAREKVLSNSKFICFTARFLPGLRAPIYLTAGIMGVRPAVFLLLDGFAALISVPVWIVVGWWFGNNLDRMLEIVVQIQGYLIVGVVVVIGGYLLWRRHQAKKSNSVSPSDSELK